MLYNDFYTVLFFADKPDGNVPSRVRSDGNLSASDLRLSASTLSSASLASTMSLSSLVIV